MSSIFLDPPTVYGLHLICAQDRLLSLVTDLEQARAAHAPGTLTILDWGWSCKLHTGYIVLRWSGACEDKETYQTYVDELMSMEAIADLCAYELPPSKQEEEGSCKTTDWAHATKILAPGPIHRKVHP